MFCCPQSACVLSQLVDPKLISYTSATQLSQFPLRPLDTPIYALWPLLWHQNYINTFLCLDILFMCKQSITFCWLQNKVMRNLPWTEVGPSFISTLIPGIWMNTYRGPLQAHDTAKWVAVLFKWSSYRDFALVLVQFWATSHMYTQKLKHYTKIEVLISYRCIKGIWKNEFPLDKVRWVKLS